MLKTILFVGLGGGLGSILRYLVSYFSTRFFHINFPIGTFVVNIFGCLLLGLLTGWLERQSIVDSQLRWFFVTGFCGGFTTFSTFSVESLSLLQHGNIVGGISYIVASVFFGLLAVWVGFVLIK